MENETKTQSSQAPVESVVITHSIVRTNDGIPSSHRRGEITVLCMWLLRNGWKDAAESLAKMTKWDARKFVPLDKPTAFAKKDCDCKYAYDCWWFWSEVDSKR